MSENICYKFGTPHSLDLQKLQEVCFNVTSTDSHIQNFLLFIAGAFFLFIIFVLFAKVFTSNKKIIDAYYKSAFTYFIQIFTVITTIPIILYFFDNSFNIISKLTITVGIFGIIFVIYEYWPVYKKSPEINNSIISTIFLTIFTISLYHTFNMDVNNKFFVDIALVSIFMIYIIFINILIKMISEIKRHSSLE